MTEDGEFKEVCFNKKDFIQLADIRSNMSDLDFNDQQHYDFATIKKMIRITKIDKIIYANGDTNLVLFNLHTYTYDFPLAIESEKNGSSFYWKGSSCKEFGKQ